MSRDSRLRLADIVDACTRIEDYIVQRLGELREVETVLAKEFYRLACYAERVAFAPGSTTLRVYQTAPLLRNDGTVVRVLIYFILREDDSVELWDRPT